MPLLEITSPRTGKTYQIEGTGTPTEADIEEIGNQLDAQEAQRAGVDPAVLQQGPLGTFVNTVRNIGPEFVDMTVGGVAKLNDAIGRSPLAALSPLGMAGQAVQGMAGLEQNPLATVADATRVIRETGEDMRPVNPFNETARTVGGAVNQIGGMVATGGLGVAAGMAPQVAMKAIPAAIGFAAGAGQGVDTAKEMGITSPTAQAAMGGAFGAVEMLTEKLGGIGGDVVDRFVRPSSMLGRAAMNVASESGEEVLAGRAQDALTVAAGQTVADPQRPGFTQSGYQLPSLNPLNPDTLNRMKQEAIGGAAGGVIFSGLQMAANRSKPNELPTPQTPGTPPTSNATAPLGRTAGASDEPGLQEHTGDLTAADVADMERPRVPGFTDPAAGVMQLDPQADLGRDFQLKQQAPAFRDDPFAQPQEASGNVITDLRIPRSPEAIAESQRLEQERLTQQARLRNLEAKTGRGPLIPDSPLGSYDILDFVNENRIRMPKTGAARGGEYDWTETYSVPPYYRQFLGNTESGSSIDQVAQMAFENGFIREPTADALMGAVSETIATRKQYRVEFAKQAREQRQAENRALDFEKTQGQLRQKDKSRVMFEDIAPGDAMRIDGEPVTVARVDYDEDGYLTNVVLQDGKRFGVMQFDPQNRSGIFVDEWQPAAQRGNAFASRAFPGIRAIIGQAARAEEAMPGNVLRSLFSPPAAANSAPAGTAGTRKGLGAGAWFQNPAKSEGRRAESSAAPSPASPQIPREQWLGIAYQHAARGQGTAFVPLQRVFDTLRQAVPDLTAEQFAAEVRAAYDSNQLVLEGANSQQEAQQGLAIEGTPVGTAVRMAVPEMARSFASRPESRQNAAMASDPGAAQNTEPSPGGLSENEWHRRDFQERYTAAQDLQDRAREYGIRLKINGDGTITFYHGTSKSNASSIRQQGFQSQTYFSHRRDVTGFGDSGPDYYAIQKIKDGEVMQANLDPRDVSFASGTGEFYLENAAPNRGNYFSSHGFESSRAEGGTTFASRAASAPNEMSEPGLKRAVALGTGVWDQVWGPLKKPVRFKPAQGHADNGRFTPTDGVHDEIELNAHAAGLEEDAITVVHELAHAQDSTGLQSMTSENPAPGTPMAALMAELNENLPTAQKLNAAAAEWQVKAKTPEEREVADHLAYLARPEERFARAVEQVTRWLSQGRVLTGAGGYYESGYLTVPEMQRILPLLHDILGHGTQSTRLSPAQNQPGGSETGPGSRDRSSRPEPAPGGSTGNDRGGNEGLPGQPAETVNGVPNETQSRFASPNEADRAINGPRTDAQVAAEARQWLDTVDTATAVEQFAAQAVPLPLDAQQHAAGVLIARLSEQATKGGTEVLRMWAHVQGQRMARIWTQEFLSADPARGLRQRAVVNNGILAPIAPVLAAQEMLVDRANKAIKPRFEGGVEGAVEKVKKVVKKADTQAAEELAGDLDATEPEGNTPANADPKRRARAATLRSKHPNLAKMLDALRKKMYPGLKWADIFMDLPATQKERQREIYARLLKDQRLQKLTQAERLELTNELDKAWQRERRKVFLRELEKAKVLGEKSPKDREKVKAAAPRLLRLMNLGMLNSELFREALAKEYGVKQIDAAKAAELRKLGEDIQNAPEGLPRKRLEVRLLERLQELTDSTALQLLESYWTAAVLSGWRTQVDIALSLANGIEDVGLGSLVTAFRTGNADVAWRAITALFRTVPQAMGEAWDHLLTGNKTLMRNAQIEAANALSDGSRLSADAGAELWRKGGWRKIPGGFMLFYGRLMHGLDHINSTSTAEGAKLMALARHPELYQKAIRTSPADRAAALKQARAEMPDAKEIEIRARVQEILDKYIPTEIIGEAREIGRMAALQGDPTGLGAMVMTMVSRVLGVPAQMEKAMEKQGLDNPAAKAVMAALRFASTTGRVLTGTKFLRTVAHSINRTVSYAPGIGLLRFAESGMKGTRADILLAKQLTGTVAGLALLAALRSGADDDEQGIEGSWEGLTPGEKSQLYSQGKQPYTVWSRNAQGKIVSWNYQQWGLAGILATLGAMEDQRRYNGHNKADVNILLNGIAQGAMSWADKAQLQGLQTVLDGSFRSTDPAQSLAGRLNKFASQTVGGLIPRITKDIDAVAHPALHDSSEWWMKWAQQVPMVRELSSGKRVDIFGQDILLDRTPTSRVVQIGTADPAYRVLGLLNERDVWLPDPTTGVRVVRTAGGGRRDMTPAEKDRYQRLTGQGYRQFIEQQGMELLRLHASDPERVHDIIRASTKRIRDVAAMQATR